MPILGYVAMQDFGVVPVRRTRVHGFIARIVANDGFGCRFYVLLGNFSNCCHRRSRFEELNIVEAVVRGIRPSNAHRSLRPIKI